MKKKKIAILGSVAILIIVAAVLAIAIINRGKIKPEEARVKVENFVNTYLMSDGSKATVSDVSESYGLYKMKINIGSGQTVDSYVSLDGKLFFPQALDIAKTISEAGGAASDTGANEAPVATDIPKNDKPKIELFVMSHCPYGTQMEKGILPVISALGKKIDFEIKFNDYAMHGEKELKEQLSQYCIQKEQGAKFTTYLESFLTDSNSDNAITKAGVDKDKLADCVAKTDKEFKVLENFASKTDYRGSYPGFAIYAADNTKYSVGGSPTLIINGVDASSGRDSASLLKTICSAFEEAPEECNTVLSSASPAPGFGTGTTANSAAASCE